MAQRQLESLKAQRAVPRRASRQRRRSATRRKLNLSYTTVTAAAAGAGRQSHRGAVGEFAQPGTNLTMFVPDETWVTANFKETQLDQCAPASP